MITTVLNRSGVGFWRIGILSALACLLFVLRGQSQVKFIFQDNFENAPVFGNPSVGYANWDETCCGWSFTNSDSAFRSSSKAGRFDLRKSDPSPQPNDSKRTQMEWNGMAVPMGATWYAMSIMPAGWMGVDPAPEDLFDLHDRLPSGAGSNWTNPFGIWNKNGRWTCHITYDVVNITTDGGSNIVNKEYDLGPVVPGKWVDWVLHTNYSWRDTGYVEVYKDGVKVVDYKGPCAYNGCMPDPYFKFGIYKWPWAISSFNPASTQSERVFYFDNFRVGGRWNTINDFLIITGPPPANQPPIANAGTDLSITLPTSTANLNGSASSDPDGTISNYAWTQTSGPNTATIASAGSATTAISNLVQGTYNFTLTITDNAGATATDVVVITVNAAAVNQAPTADAGTDLNIQMPTTTASLSGSGVDKDGTISKYAWSQASGPKAATIANASAASTAISNLAQGTYTFNLTITDNGGKTATDAVVVTVAAAPAANQPPAANAGTDLAITLPTNTVNLDGSNSKDPDGTISIYAWTQVSGPGTATFGNAGAATTSLNGLVQGSYVIKLTVTDNLGLSATDQVTVTVNAAPVANKKPVAVPGQNKKIALPTTSTNLNGTSSYDPDGNITSFNWTQTSGPSNATIGSSSSASTNVGGLQQGNYTFRLTVTDNQGATGMDSITVTVDPAPVAPNQPPVANAGVGLIVVLPTNTVTLNGSASSDPDGSIATYAWSQMKGPNSANIGFPTSTNTGVSGLIQGVYLFNLIVTDNKGMSSSDTVQVTVNPQPAPGPNQAPVANSGGSKSITLPTSTVTLNGASSYDPDGSIATYSWAQISGPSSADIQTAAGSSTSIGSLVAGIYEFELTVTDNKGLTAKDKSVVTVNNPVAPAPPANAPPVAVANDTVVITLPVQNTSLDGSKSFDNGGSIAAYSWAYVSGPTTVVLDNTDQAIALAKDLVAGTYVFSLTVTDNQGATDTKTVSVMVMNSATRPQFAVVTYYPNPAQSHTILKVEGSSRGNAVLQIYNTAGVMVRGILLYIDQQTFTKDIDLSGLPRGTYLMVLKIGTQKQIVKKLQIL